jgi:hypothetical protein
MLYDTSVVPALRTNEKKSDASTTTKKKEEDDQSVPQAMPTGAWPTILHNNIDVNDCRPAPPRRKPNPPTSHNDASENRPTVQASAASVSAVDYILID